VKIVYIGSATDHTDLSNPGGVSQYIIKSMRELGATVLTINANPNPYLMLMLKIKSRVYKFFGFNILFEREKILLKSSSKKIDKRLENLDVDAILSFGTLPIAFLKNDIPKYAWTDAVFESILNYYPYYQNLTAFTIKNGHQLEKLALKKLQTIFFCSHFPIDFFNKYYPKYRDKAIIATFGPNCETNLKEQDIDEIIEKKDKNIINLLFIGYDWARKGGDLIVETVNAMNKMGQHTVLNVIGVKLNKYQSDKIRFHGKINKNTPDGKNQFENLIKQSHFFLLFSKAESFGHVIAEANSFGLPTIVTNTGGLSEIVCDNRNGLKIGLDKKPEEIAKKILNLTYDQESYKKLCKNSYLEFKENLNWQKGAKIVFETIENDIHLKNH